MKKKVSLKDIADKVGVSTALVSYVLNNKFKDRISKEVAAKIRQTALDLNYQPNQIARSLKINKTYTIGLIVADISNPFSSQIARIIENEAKSYGYSVFFSSSDENADKTIELIKLMLNRQVDGLIIAMPQGAEQHVTYLNKNQIPFVLIDRQFHSVQANSVTINNFAAGKAAIQHLLKNGYKRIGIVSYKSNLFNLNERIRGACDLLGADNYRIGEICEDNIDSDTAKVMSRLLEDVTPVDAIFFTTNLLTVSGLKYINSIGFKVPDQIGIVGFDQTDAFDLFYTPISYVNQPMRDLGKISVKLLLDAIYNIDNLKQIVLNAELIVQNSSSKRE